MFVKRIAINTALLSFGRIASGILQIAIAAMLARLFGVAGYGKYSFAITYVAFFNVLCVFLDTILIREVSRCREDASRWIGCGVVIKTFFCCCALLLSVICTSFFKFPRETIYLISLLSLSLLFNIIQTPRIIFEVDLRAKYIVGIELVNKILAILFLIIACTVQINLFLAASAILFSDFIMALNFLFFSRKFVKFQAVFDYPIIKKLLREGFPIAVLAILSVIYLRIDIMMLAFIKGDMAVGYYSAASNIMASIMIFPDAYARSVFPIISNFFNQQRDRLIFIFMRSLKHLLAGGIFVTIIGLIFSRHIMIAIMGTAFLPASQSLAILSIAIGVIFISNILTVTIMAVNRQDMNMWFALANMGVCVLLNSIIIPLFSYTGAAAVRVVTEATGCSMALFFTMRYFRISFSFSWVYYFFRLLGVIFLTVIVAHFLSPVYFPIAIFILGVAYLLFLILFKWFDEEDANMFKSIFGGKRL